MIENARAHLVRRLAEAEYLDERDAMRREHKEPGISCNILKAETGLFNNLPANDAIEIDAATDDNSRIEHAGRKVNAAGTLGVCSRWVDRGARITPTAASGNAHWRHR